MLIIFCPMTLFNKMINYRDISKKLILRTFTSYLRGKISNMLFHCQTRCFFGVHGGIKRSPENGFRVSGLEDDCGQYNSSTTMNKIVKIRSQPAKYKYFAEIKPANIISRVAQYRIIGNCDHHSHYSSLITIHYCGQEQN